MLKNARGMGWRGLAAAGLVFATTGVARAADSPYDPRGGRDQAIITQLHQRNQDLIAAARVAERRASRADVKDYAERVIEQRELADAQLLTYAQQEGMNMEAVQAGSGALAHGSLATAPLNNVSTSRFDAFFAQDMNAREQAAADEAVHAQKLAFGEQLGGLIRDQIPTLRQEQATAANLNAALPLPAPALQQPGEVEVVSWTLPGAPR
jgi:predicted outer membrane protein